MELLTDSARIQGQYRKRSNRADRYPQTRLMKTTPSRFGKTPGQCPSLTVVITGLIGFVLAVYLTMVQNQNSANTRSQVWNSAMPVVEAGIEDALAHLNTARTTQSVSATAGPFRARPIPSRDRGRATYSARISNFAAGTNTSRSSRALDMLYAPTLMLQPPMTPCWLGQAKHVPSIFTSARGVRVQTRQDMIFTKGMVAKDTIDLNGNNITANSFRLDGPQLQHERQV
jgi:hypothetical protein